MPRRFGKKNGHVFDDDVQGILKVENLDTTHKMSVHDVFEDLAER